MDRYEIAQLIEDGFDNILADSLKNCHAFGLHSIVLNKHENGLLTRLFVARDWHELWKNEFNVVGGVYPKMALSLAIHPHHCGVNLKTVVGEFTNYEFAEAPLDATTRFSKFEYISPIRNQTGKFIRKELASVQLIATNRVFVGQHIDQLPRQLHTVYVPKREMAAWLVTEHDEDPFYKAICYSNANLEHFSFDGMYRPMSPSTLKDIVQWLKGEATDR